MTQKEQDNDDRVKAQLLPAVCAVAMIFAGIVGTSVLNRLEKLDKKVIGLQIDMAVVKTDLAYIKTTRQASIP